MKKLFILLVAASGLINLEAQASLEVSPRVYYGEDDRELISSLKTQSDKFYVDQSRAVFAQVKKSELIPTGDQYLIKVQSLAKTFNMCKNENFAYEPSVSSCTAFLVAPDIIMTAGHCVVDKDDCRKAAWIMDYKFKDNLNIQGDKKLLFKQSNIVTCAEVISSKNSKMMDYAIIRLNKKVTDRQPLKIRTNGLIEKGEELHVIGHPLGMPKTLTTNVIVTKISEKNVFSASADAFGGNSGSPVINKATGLVEGILVRGESDFTFKYTGLCNQIKRCSFLTCGSGEQVQRTTVLPLNLIK